MQIIFVLIFVGYEKREPFYDTQNTAEKLNFHGERIWQRFNIVDDIKNVIFAAKSFRMFINQSLPTRHVACCPICEKRCKSKDERAVDEKYFQMTSTEIVYRNGVQNVREFPGRYKKAQKKTRKFPK